MAAVLMLSVLLSSIYTTISTGDTTLSSELSKGKYTFEDFTSYDALKNSHPNADKWVTIKTKEIDSACDMTIHVFGNLKDLPIEDIIKAANDTRLCPDLHLLLKALKKNAATATEETTEIQNIAIYAADRAEGLEAIAQKSDIDQLWNKISLRLNPMNRVTPSGRSQHPAITVLLKVVPSQIDQTYPQLFCWHENRNGVFFFKRMSEWSITERETKAVLEKCLNGEIEYETLTEINNDEVRQLEKVVPVGMTARN